MLETPFVTAREVPRTPRLIPSESIVKISPESSGLRTRVQIVPFSTATLILELEGVDISTLDRASSRNTDSSEKTIVVVDDQSVSIPYPA